MPAMQQIYASSTQLKFNFPALSILVNDLLSVDVTSTPSRDNENDIEFLDKLNITNLSFSYPGVEKPTLNNINLQIESNKTIGLVGSTGSGKTTLVDVFLGLLNPTSGNISVDGEELTAKNIKSWQKNVGYVPQDIYLVDDTIESNIAFGERVIDFDKVKKAAITSELDEFIKTLPNGYKTIVGERGVRLSGGQKQRIGIARALYHNPKILVLDEATSSLDGETESYIIKAINNLSHKKTILMIAHRVSTLKSCDMIYVMESGKIVASDTYKNLLLSNKIFQGMANN